MRLRCPNNDCPLDVPDDLLGVRIRCPHCGKLMFVDAQYAEGQIQAGAPPITGDEAKNGANEPNLENQIYDGLPPLAVMMALRRQQGRDHDAGDLIRRYEMTPDDWRALDAFEQVLHARFQVKTVLIFCLLGVLASMYVAGSVLSLPPLEEIRLEARLRTLGNLGGMLLLLAGVAVTMFAGECFGSLRRGGWTPMLPWGILVVALVFGSVAAVNSMTLLRETTASLAFPAVVSLPVHFCGAFAATAACWRVTFALVRVRPPEIHHRLTEALKYLE